MTSKPRIPCEHLGLPAQAPSNPANPHTPAAGDKAGLRARLKALRSSLDPLQKAAWDARIGARVLAWWHALPGGAAESLGVYWPLRGEADLTPAYQALAQAGARLVLPVVLARDTALGFAEWQPGEAMESDAMGVAVPAHLRPALRPAALLVPCLGFNAAGYRLGYGGGYYDRTLAALPRPVTVGVAYSCLEAQFASAPHDVALDLMITEASA